MFAFGRLRATAFLGVLSVCGDLFFSSHTPNYERWRLGLRRAAPGVSVGLRRPSSALRSSLTNSLRWVSSYRRMKKIIDRQEAGRNTPAQHPPVQQDTAATPSPVLGGRRSLRQIPGVEKLNEELPIRQTTEHDDDLVGSFEQQPAHCREIIRKRVCGFLKRLTENAQAASTADLCHRGLSDQQYALLRSIASKVDDGNDNLLARLWLVDYVRPCKLVAGAGFEPATFRLPAWLIDSSRPHRLWFYRVQSFDSRGTRRDGLLHESVEQLAAVPGKTPVETESELVEIRL